MMETPSSLAPSLAGLRACVRAHGNSPAGPGNDEPTRAHAPRRAVHVSIVRPPGPSVRPVHAYSKGCRDEVPSKLDKTRPAHAPTALDPICWRS
jgi:hypothetical protein